MDDGAVWVPDEIDHDGDCGGVLVPGDYERSGCDQRGVTGLVEKRPDVAGLVLGLQVGSTKNPTASRSFSATRWTTR